jgi:hypothetical protein
VDPARRDHTATLTERVQRLADAVTGARAAQKPLRAAQCRLGGIAYRPRHTKLCGKGVRQALASDDGDLPAAQVFWGDHAGSSSTERTPEITDSRYCRPSSTATSASSCYSAAIGSPRRRVLGAGYRRGAALRNGIDVRGEATLACRLSRSLPPRLPAPTRPARPTSWSSPTLAPAISDTDRRAPRRRRGARADPAGIVGTAERSLTRMQQPRHRGDVPAERCTSCAVTLGDGAWPSAFYGVLALALAPAIPPTTSAVSQRERCQNPSPPPTMEANAVQTQPNTSGNRPPQSW